MSELRHFPGSEQTIEIILDGEDTGGELALMRLKMPPGAGASRHRHLQEAETLVVLDGGLRVELEGVERTLLPGEAIFLPRASLHAFRSDGGAVVEVVTTPAGLEKFFRVACPLEADDPPPAEADLHAALESAGLDFSGV